MHSVFVAMETVYQKTSCIMKILGRARLACKQRKCLLKEMHGGLWAVGRSCVCWQQLLLGEDLPLEQNNLLLQEIYQMHHFQPLARCILAACDIELRVTVEIKPSVTSEGKSTVNERW